MARAAPDSRQQAHTIPYSLARALRALAGGLSWERLGRNALLENASEILSKSLPEAARDLPELTLALLGFLRVILGLLGLILILALPGRSREPLGSLLGPGTLLGRSREPRGASWPPKLSKIAPGGSPGGPPHRSLILDAFWVSCWLHFGTPRTSKTRCSCGGCCIF